MFVYLSIKFIFLYVMCSLLVFVSGLLDGPFKSWIYVFLSAYKWLTMASTRIWCKTWAWSMAFLEYLPRLSYGHSWSIHFDQKGHLDAVQDVQSCKIQSNTMYYDCCDQWDNPEKPNLNWFIIEGPVWCGSFGYHILSSRIIWLSSLSCVPLKVLSCSAVKLLH